jgi:hypothetical protein
MRQQSEELTVTTKQLRSLAVVLFSCLALPGCGSALPPTAIVPSAVAIRETSAIDLAQSDLDEAERVGDVSAGELGKYDLTAKSYEKQDLEGVYRTLNGAKEEALLSFLKFVREDTRGSKRMEGEFYHEIHNQLEGRFAAEVMTALTAEDRTQLLSDLKALYAPESDVSPTPPPAPTPAPPPDAPPAPVVPATGAVRALKKSEIEATTRAQAKARADAEALARSAWARAEAQRAQVEQRVSLGLDRVANGAQRRLTSKRRLESWLRALASKHAFNPSITLTLDLANPDQKPIVASERIYVSMPGVDARSFTLRNRDCNEGITACRILFVYDLTQSDVKRLGVLQKRLFEEYKTRDFKEQLRAYLDESTVGVEIFVDGRDEHLSMPGRLIKVD